MQAHENVWGPEPEDEAQSAIDYEGITGEEADAKRREPHAQGLTVEASPEATARTMASYHAQFRSWTSGFFAQRRSTREAAIGGSPLPLTLLIAKAELAEARGRR